ncbi:MAG: hypothetical protein CME66_06385 [Halobacteriovoraceae bacterium]|nr:hypothetical protein [Halobacteriovoraceae bacterium]
MKKILFTVLFISSYSSLCHGSSLVGRLGIGATNHLESKMPAISLKLQRNRSSALGGHFAMDSSSNGLDYALGIKGYRYIYEEPQLNFYSALAGTYFTYTNEADDKTEQGYQIDGTFGAEFSFQGLESVGFSFEFGIGLSEYQKETHLKTVGHNMMVSAVHFYL